MRNTSVFSNFSLRDYRYSTNTKFTVRRTNTYTHTYIHTYIHTDTVRVQHINVGLAQARPNYWGERSEPHTCGENGKLSIYIYMVRAYSVYTSCPICARCNISTLHVNHCCSRDKTNRTERLNSGNQRNRNLKTVRKGRHYYQDGG